MDTKNLIGMRVRNVVTNAVGTINTDRVIPVQHTTAIFSRYKDNHLQSPDIKPNDWRQVQGINCVLN